MVVGDGAAPCEQLNEKGIEMDEYDVAIVGASIAGCAGAVLLARQGAKVALIESHSNPQAFKRVCTHYIQPSAVPTMERLGLLEPIVAAGARYSDVHTWTRYGWFTFAHGSSEPPASEYSGWNIRRETLDPIVRGLAAGTQGVEMMLGRTVTGLLRDGKRVSGVVAREQDGREQELRAKVVVGADGRGSQVAKLAGLSTKVKKNGRFTYFAYYRDTPTATGDDMQVWFLDPDVAFAFPTDGGLTMLACAVDKSRLSDFKSDPEREMQRVFDGLADGPRLDPAKRESKMIGALDVTNLSRPPSFPGLALIGDAATACDNLPGVGCGWALESAEWLAEAVAGPLRGGDPAAIDGALKTYARRHRRSLDMHRRMISATSAGRKFDPMSKLLFRAAARDQEIANRMLLVAARWISPLQLFKEGMLKRFLLASVRRDAPAIGLIPRTPVISPADRHERTDGKRQSSEAVI
jgi:menaquinone-9 beta-reductase